MGLAVRCFEVGAEVGRDITITLHRHIKQPRPDWPARVEAIGLTYHTHDCCPYWDESAYYRLSSHEVALLEASANAVHQLYLEAAQAVISRGWWDRLAIPHIAVPAILASWERDDFSLYGRFDFAFDGDGPPKLLEYNADTPTALIEASVAQWFWLQDCFPEADQFNSIHERLIDAWKRSGIQRLSCCSVLEHPEDEQTVRYLQDTAIQAGCEASTIGIEQIGWHSERRRFVDLNDAPIDVAFKLYPWEWLWHEQFGQHLVDSGTQFVEPVWKMLVSNKGLLPILWELFPEHPNLLAAFDSPEPLAGNYVRKPMLGREGQNVSWIERGRELEKTTGEYGGEGFVYQALAGCRPLDGNWPIAGVWMIDQEAAGVGFREDQRRITGNLSRFVPHLFEP